LQPPLHQVLPGFLGAVLIVAVLGCTSVGTGGKVWYKENGTTEERDRLLAAAQVQAAQAHSGPSAGLPDTAQAKQQSAVETTMTYMTEHGWHLVPPSEAKPLASSPATSQSSTPSTVSSMGLDR